MSYSLEMTARFNKELSKLDPFVARAILKWLIKHIDRCDNPRALGKPLQGKHVGEWRYRIGHYRFICIIDDATVTVLAIAVGHRKQIYH